MAKFEFRNKKVELEFPNITVTIDINENTGTLINESSAELEDNAERAAKNPQIIIDVLTKYIDKFCGAGVTPKIMAGDHRDMHDYIQVYWFIISEITAHYKAAKQKYLPPYVK